MAGATLLDGKGADGVGFDAMSEYFSDKSVWFDSTPEIRALDGRKLIVVDDAERDLKIEDDPSGSKKIAVAATALPLSDVPNEPDMKEGRPVKGYLTKDALRRLKPGSEFGCGDNYVVLDPDE